MKQWMYTSPSLPFLSDGVSAFGVSLGSAESIRYTAAPIRDRAHNSQQNPFTLPCRSHQPLPSRLSATHREKESRIRSIMPVRKRIALVDQRISRSQLSAETDPRELLEQQHALQDRHAQSVYHRLEPNGVSIHAGAERNRSERTSRRTTSR